MSKASQLQIEAIYSKQNIKKQARKLHKDIPEVKEVIAKGTAAIDQLIAGEYYDSKMVRMNQIKTLEIFSIAEDVIFALIASPRAMTLSTLVGQLIRSLGFGDQYAGAKTMAEIITVMAQADCINISKKDKYSQMMVETKVAANPEFIRFVNNTRYLPPMITKPEVLISNDMSGYLASRGTVFAGSKFNYHEGNVNLRSINRFNAIALTLDVDFLRKYEERALKPEKIDTDRKLKNWEAKAGQTAKICMGLIQNGNKFYLTHKVGAVGRTYAQGYHISTQGDQYRKAMLQFHKKQLVEGF